MKTHVFQRADGAMVLVPALFQLPLHSHGQGLLVLLGTRRFDLDQLNPDVVLALGDRGYAELTGDAARKLQAFMAAAGPVQASHAVATVAASAA